MRACGGGGSSPVEVIHHAQQHQRVHHHALHGQLRHRGGSGGGVSRSRLSGSAAPGVHRGQVTAPSGEGFVGASGGGGAKEGCRSTSALPPRAEEPAGKSGPERTPVVPDPAGRGRFAASGAAGGRLRVTE